MLMLVITCVFHSLHFELGSHPPQFFTQQRNGDGQIWGRLVSDWGTGVALSDGRLTVRPKPTPKCPQHALRTKLLKQAMRHFFTSRLLPEAGWTGTDGLGSESNAYGLIGGYKVYQYSLCTALTIHAFLRTGYINTHYTLHSLCIRFIPPYIQDPNRQQVFP
jgi:hypothetical protein